MFEVNYDEVRKNRLATIILDTNIITTSSFDSKKIYNFQKISSNYNQINLLEDYKKLREDCDKIAYSVKWLDAIGDKISETVAPVIRPIIKSVQSMASSIDDGTMEASKGLVGTAASGRLNERIYKISKINNSKFDQIKFIEEQILLLAREEGIQADSLEKLSAKIKILKKEAISVPGYIGKNLKGIGKGLGSATLKSIPFIGIVTDLTLTVKNIYEAWQNGKKIILELPLNKYKISYTEALIPTPFNTTKIAKQLEELSLAYKNSPNDLSNILNISQTLKGYATDFVSTITNLLMTILDILEYIPSGIGALASFVISMPIIAVEMANDTLVNAAYDKSISLIKNICDQKIIELSIKSDSKNLSEIISEDQKDFMRKFLEGSKKSEEVTDVAPSDKNSINAYRTARKTKINNFMKFCC